MRDSVEFDVDVVGELSGGTFKGIFKAKTKLSLREKLRQEEQYRTLLGAKAEDASPYAKSIASAVSYISAHVTKAPSWWEDFGGMDLEDENVLVAVNDALIKEMQKAYEEHEKKGEKAREELKAHKEEE